MKMSKALIVGMVAFSVFSISAATLAARSTAPDIGYFSDATYTNMVGEKTYGCYGGSTMWGVQTAYSQVLFVVQCG